jgi:hypothetical protein
MASVEDKGSQWGEKKEINPHLTVEEIVKSRIKR